ncbi:MAG: hypothetical protein FPO08_07625 [Geobacter sp.]|nr:MAG: hypothetical protein FPO08_07625 [Geobacter sp.]
MQKIRFVGLAKEAAGNNVGLISEWTGYEVIREGDDIVVPATDERLQSGPRPVLLTEKKPLSLASEIEEIADLYVKKYFRPQFEAKPKTGPFPIAVSLPYGLHSRLEEKRLAFFYSRTKDAVRKVLVNEILPFMRDEMDARSVFPMAVDFQYQLAMICLNQVGAGIRQFGMKWLRFLRQGDKQWTDLFPEERFNATTSHPSQRRIQSQSSRCRPVGV